MRPFIHQNTTLAIALHFAGAHITDIRNIYTAEMLRKWGCRTEEEAIKAGRVGTCHFHHVHTSNLEALLLAFTEQCAAEGGELASNIDPADVVRLVVEVLKSRKHIQDNLHDIAFAWVADHLPEMPPDYVKWLQAEGSARAKYKAAMDDYERRKKAGERVAKPSADQILTRDEMAAIMEPRSFSLPGFKMAKAQDSKSRRHLGL